MILCFSGTGNTRAVARRLAKQLDERVVEVNLDMDLSLDASGDSRIIWCFPVHAWDMPRFVRDVMRNLEIENGRDIPHFMVATCGDDIGLTHRSWHKAVRRRGWNPLSAYSVFMPNTYVLLPGFDVDSQQVRQEKLENAIGRIDHIARAIKCRSAIDIVTEGSVPGIKSRVLSPLFKAFLMSPRPFHTTDACVACGRCVSVCPMKNISMNEETQRPQWNDYCTLCLGCYHVCPHHAVAYGKITQRKGQSYLSASAANIVVDAT